MNKICKEYMGEIRTLFPIKKKDEKAYLKKLATDVEDYCEEAKVESKQELYDNYGMPYEVVSNYLSTVDTDYIVKQLRISKFLRRAIVALLVLAVAATTARVIYLQHAHDVIEHNRLVVEGKIVDYGEIKEGTYTKGFFAEEFYE